MAVSLSRARCLVVVTAACTRTFRPNSAVAVVTVEVVEAVPVPVAG